MDWHFVVDGEDRFVRVPEGLVVNDTDAYAAGALQGLGLIRAGQLHDASAPHQRLISGRLRRVPTDVPSPAVPLSVLYARNRHLSPTVRALAD